MHVWTKSAGYLLPKNSSTNLPVSNCCKSRWVGWLDWSGTQIVLVMSI